ncbi:MAG: formylglycine-generating enzyme family protein [Elusimicrobiota bacterium]
MKKEAVVSAAVGALLCIQGCATTAPRISAGKSGLEWVRIPGGSYTMGSGTQDEAPAHRVAVKPFELARTLVTNKQYKDCVVEGACSPAESKGETFEGDDQPVVGVDWNQARAFCAWAGGRLPSEAEWEYAARGAGRDREYPWGDEDAACDKAVVGGCRYKATAPVCSKPAGKTRQGLCDMAGNAWEWVQDWYHSSYYGAPKDALAWEDKGAARVVRGGSWYNVPKNARCADRVSYDPSYRSFDLGFRPAR